MPSETRLRAVMAALAQPIAGFRALLDDAITQAERMQAAQSAFPSVTAATAAAGLGEFARGRIDAARFAAVFPSEVALDPPASAALQRALEHLRTARDEAERVFTVALAPGQRLGVAAGQALARIGGIFGAMTLAGLVRGGHYQPADHDGLLEPQDFLTWGRAARRHAPPLVVTLTGADLHPAALADYADGTARIVLVVSGPAGPAPLARCITPGTMVLQTTDGTGLDRVAAFDGPAIAAWMPEGAAVFLHHPEGGRESWQRLTVTSLGEVPRHTIGGTSVWQMSQDQALLADLARTPFAVPALEGTGPAMGAGDAVERIAAWLLAQSTPADR